MSWQWEEDIDIFADDVTKLRPTWHLKWVVPAPPEAQKPFRLGVGPYKISYAWVNRLGKRKYAVRFVRIDGHYDNKTFRSLAQAKLYAVAIAELNKD